MRARVRARVRAHMHISLNVRDRFLLKQLKENLSVLFTSHSQWFHGLMRENVFKNAFFFLTLTLWFVHLKEWAIAIKDKEEEFPLWLSGISGRQEPADWVTMKHSFSSSLPFSL